tara:strand:+ start:185 stop:442 length:258 start_codon:yes stop_codon:yes gene_type:complete
MNYLVEFIGALILIFMIIVTKNPLMIGLTLTTIIIIGEKISGGHFNPAVSVAMYYLGKLNIDDLLPYIVAQICGGLVGYKLTKVF